MGNAQIHTTLIKYIFIFHYIILQQNTHMFLHTNIQIKLNATVTATAAAYDAVVWHGKFTTLQKNNPQQYKNLGKKNQF